MTRGANELDRCYDVSYRSGLCALACIFSACTGPPIQPSPSLGDPAEQIVVLRHQTGFNNPSVYFVQVDGTRLSEKQYADLRLLPGRHEVEFGYETVRWFPLRVERSRDDAKVTFEAVANHEYEARAEKLPATNVILGTLGPGNWEGTIVDQATCSVMGDSTLEANHATADGE